MLSTDSGFLCAGQIYTKLVILIDMLGMVFALARMEK